MKQQLSIFAIMLAGLTLTACGQQQDESASTQAGAEPAGAGAQEHPGNGPDQAGADEHPGQGSQGGGATAGSGLGENPAPGAGSAAQGSSEAAAELAPTEGNKVSGTVTFVQSDEGVHVYADLKGLKPGKHGFHVHENGDCSAPDGKSAGGHFNPGGAEHGAPTDAEHHEGDMGNITADPDGTAMMDEDFDFLQLGEGPKSIIGKAVIVHGGEDDLTSQPSGAAGPRVACGVIKQQGATGINSQQ